MEARDIMTPEVIRVEPDMPIQEVAKLMAENRISAVPVAKDGELVGIVSEGDMLRRVELGTERHRSHWLEFFTFGTTLASEYVKAHGQTAEDIMTRDVITVTPATPVGQIARLLETKHIKRVPVVEDSRLVGIVSRANLVQALASLSPAAQPKAKVSDREIREALFREMRQRKWAFAPSEANVTVTDGVVSLWGFINSESARQAMLVAGRGIPGVQRVEDHMKYPRIYPYVQPVL
jgi:CBS domain-containing protein